MNILVRKTNSSTEFWLKQMIKLSITVFQNELHLSLRTTKQTNPDSYATCVVC